MRRLLREAVDAGRIELYLQPVVTLPQRKVRFYEALSRIKLADGTLVEPEHFLEGARAFGLCRGSIFGCCAAASRSCAGSPR